MRARYMRARLQTNPDIVQLSIIARRDEWNTLIKVLSEIEPEGKQEESTLSAFQDCINQVVNNRKSQWDIKTSKEEED